MEKQRIEKGFLRIFLEKIIIPVVAFGTGWILIYIWPPVLLIYLFLFIALIIIGAFGYWKGEY